MSPNGDSAPHYPPPLDPTRGGFLQTTPQRQQQGQLQQLVAGLIHRARREGGKLEFRHETTGAVIATLIAHDVPTRPKDMPRSLRPKGKLSKRERAAAKREKLRGTDS